jgi:hypothetical protein
MLHPTGGTAASQRARFQALRVASSSFRQSGVISSRPPAGTPAVRHFPLLKSGL